MQPGWRGLLRFFPLFLGAAAAFPGPLAADGPERAAPSAGAPLVRTFSPAEAGLGNFETLCLDAHGRLWVGSLTGGGLRVFDGVRWQSVPTDWRSDAVGMLVTAGDGTVWAGCLDEVGCLEGPADFLRSHLQRLPPEQRKFGMLRNGVALPDGALLTSTTHIVQCSRQGLRAWAIPEGVGLIFLSGGVPHFRTRDGDRSLRRLRDGVWERVEAAEIDAPGATGPLLQTEATRAWLAQQRIMNRNRLPDGRVLIGTRGAGAVIVGTDGRIEEHLTAAEGLPADLWYGVVLDRQGGVWVAHHSSLSRVDLRRDSAGWSPTSSGPGGTCLCSARRARSGSMKPGGSGRCQDSRIPPTMRSNAARNGCWAVCRRERCTAASSARC
ncbi:MAG: hypothetical protein JSR82_04525 [Verrucomicrobia bacterium]|nr:hypothetical protein [Verrucomicrobiota bacterium]